MFYILNTVLFSVAKHFYLYNANEKLHLTWLFGYIFARFFYIHTEFFFTSSGRWEMLFFSPISLVLSFLNQFLGVWNFRFLSSAQRWFLFLKSGKEVCCSHLWLDNFRERKYILSNLLSSCSLELVEQLNPETLNV